MRLPIMSARWNFVRKANIPSEVGETLHNLGEASLKAGDYGQSLDYHLKALELFRASGDKSGAAIQSYSMGTIFEYQGRYGAALKSKEEALKTYPRIAGSQLLDGGDFKRLWKLSQPGWPLR